MKNLYANQEAQVRLDSGETKWFPICKGVRQGCILSPSLFNLYAEMVIRNALEENEIGVKIGGQTTSNLRYADDTTITASGAILEEVEEKLNLDCKKISNWMKSNKLNKMWELSSQ